MADPLVTKKRITAARARIEKALPKLAERFSLTLDWPADYRRDPAVDMRQKMEAIADFLEALAGTTDTDTSGLDDGNDGVVVDNTTLEVIEDGEPDGVIDPASITKARLQEVLGERGVSYARNATKDELLLLYQQDEERRVNEESEQGDEQWQTNE